MQKILCILTALTFVSAPTFATPVKVIKTGGSRAVVEFPKGTKVQAGEVLQMSMGDEAESFSGAPGGRKNYIGLGGVMAYDLDAAAFTLFYTVQYGWNFGTFEFAPSASFSKIDSFSWGFAGQADINFVENKPGATFVPAVTASVGVTKGITIPVQAGLVGKFFILRQSPSAIRVGVSFDLTKFSGGSSKALSILSLGVQTYF